MGTAILGSMNSGQVRWPLEERLCTAAGRADCLNSSDLPVFRNRQHVPYGFSCPQGANCLWVVPGSQEDSLLPQPRKQAEMHLVLRKKEQGGGG